MGVARIQIKGNCGRDPEIKFSKAGKAYARFSVAVNENRKVGDEWVNENTTWYEVTCWESLAEAITDVVRKGDQVVVNGRFKVEEWEGANGIRYTYAITADDVGVEPKRGNGSGRQRADDLAPPF